MKKVDPFYRSGAWAKLRARALRRDGYKCVNCGTSVRGKGMVRVDHIRPRKDYPDLALYLPNLRCLCRACDNARSVEQRNRRDGKVAPQIGADGFPVGSDWGKE